MTQINIQTLILCGGLGTRFRSVSEDIPKSLAVVSGKPILSWLIGDLKKNKIKDIILATGHLSSNIEKYVGNHSDFTWNCS